MEKTNFRHDCPGRCRDRECHYLRELEDGQLVAVSCVGSCDGRCVGLADDEPAVRPELTDSRRIRATVRTKELYWEETNGPAGKHYTVSCVAGCIVGDAMRGKNSKEDCYGACIGLCYGVARVQAVTTTPALNH